MLIYKRIFKENPSSQTTQRSNTEKSYIKVANYINTNFPKINKILDFGAGLGKGTQALKKITEKEVLSYEPYPKGFTPDFKSFNKIKQKFDIVVNLNVLNVLQPDQRKLVLKQIYRCIEKGGCAIIGTRGWNGDVNQAKNFEKAEEEKAIWVLTRGQKVYQKGFDGKELAEYIKQIIPVKIQYVGNKFAKNSVIIYK